MTNHTTIFKPNAVMLKWNISDQIQNIEIVEFYNYKSIELINQYIFAVSISEIDALPISAGELVHSANGIVAYIIMLTLPNPSTPCMQHGAKCSSCQLNQKRIHHSWGHTLCAWHQLCHCLWYLAVRMMPQIDRLAHSSASPKQFWTVCPNILRKLRILDAVEDAVVVLPVDDISDPWPGSIGSGKVMCCSLALVTYHILLWCLVTNSFPFHFIEMWHFLWITWLYCDKWHLSPNPVLL